MLFQVKYGSIQFAHADLQSLYQFLEADFHPLSLYKKVKPVIEFIQQNEDLSQYVPQLEDIIITRVLKQVNCRFIQTGHLVNTSYVGIGV